MPARRRIYPSVGRDTRALRARLAAAERAIQAYQRGLGALRRITAFGLQAQSLREALQDVAREVSTCTGFPVVVIEFYDEPRQLMECVAATGMTLPADPGSLWTPVAQALSGLVARSGQAVIAPYAPNRSEYADLALRRLGAQTWVCLPLPAAERVLGTLALAHPDVIPLDEHLVTLAHSLADAVAALVARRQTEEHSAAAERQFHKMLGIRRHAIEVTARRQAEESLRQLNVTLEQRVAERTADLSAANARLQSEIAVRERAELALRESEARFRRLADNAPDIIYRFDYLPERRFTYVSTAITAAMGYTPADYYADPDLGWHQLHAEDRPQFQRLLANPESLRDPVEMRWLHRDGAVVWVEQRNTPIFDAEGRLIAVEGIVRDITERRRTSEALRESEQRYRTLVENMTQGVIVYQDGRVVFSNAATARIVGCGVDDLLHRSFEDLMGLLHTDDKPGVTTRLGLELADIALPDRPFRFYRADGELRWVSAQLTATTYDGRLAGLMVVSDVTDLKVAEERLRLSEARLHLLLDKTPAVIFSALAEDDFHTTFISESIRQVLGYAPAQFMSGTSFWASRIHPDDKAHVFGDATLLFQQGWRQYEYRCRHVDGNYRWVESGVSLMPAVDGHPAEVIGYLINITERKQAETTLRHANAELARAARAKDEFLANMSHELRTPLNTILAMSESLQEAIYGPLTERQQMAIHHVETSGYHLLALINDILDLSKVEAGRLSIEIERVVITDVCHSSMLFVRELALKKSIGLDLRLCDDIEVLEADPRRLKQMLVNLLSNAVKFTPSGGHVSLAVTADPSAGVVRFAVRDTGIGIAPEDLSRLFQPFNQLDSTLSRQHDGSGLGLALVRRLAELHGGTVTVESTLGVGSCFTITLPSCIIFPIPSPS